MPIKSQVAAIEYYIWRSDNDKWAISIRRDELIGCWKMRVSSDTHVEYPLWTTSGATYDFPERVPHYVRNRVNMFFMQLGKYGEVQDLKMFAYERVKIIREVFVPAGKV